MHEVLANALRRCSLSEASRLFEITDYDVVSELHSVLSQLKTVFEADEFLTDRNRQTVVEICFARITAAIRATSTIDTYAPALVDVLESCLNLELELQAGHRIDKDTPYTKLICDLFSCIFINYSSNVAMTIGIPVAVKALKSTNRELNTKVSCYLAMAAIHNCRLLAQHAPALITCASNGNTFLISVLQQIYPENREPFHTKVSNLVNLLPHCDLPERLSLLQLLGLITDHRSQAIIPYLNRLKIGLYHPTTCAAVLEVYQRLMQAGRADVLMDQVHALVKAAESQNRQCAITIAKLLASLAKQDRTIRKEVVNCLVHLCCKIDHSNLPLLLREVDKLSILYPETVAPYLGQLVRYAEKNTDAMPVAKLIRERCSKYVCTSICNPPDHSTVISLDPSPDTPRLSSLDRRVTVEPSDTPPTPKWQRSLEERLGPNVYSTGVGLIELMPGGRARKYPSRPGAYTRKSPPNKSRSSGSLGPLRSRSSKGESSEFFVVPNPRSHSSELNKSESSLQSNLTGSAYTIEAMESYVKVVTPVHRRRDRSTTDRSTDYRPSTSQEEALLSERAAIDRLLNKSPSPGLYRIETTFDKDSVTTRTDKQQDHRLSVSSKASTQHSAKITEQARTKPELEPPEKKQSKDMVSVATQSSDTLQSRVDPREVMRPPNPSSHNIRSNGYIPQGDALKHFCEKHQESIRKYVNDIMPKYPIPFRCAAEEWKRKSHIRVHFQCQEKSKHCLHDGADDRFFSFKTRYPRTWLHLMFLSYQAHSPEVLSQHDSSVAQLRRCWEYLPRSFTKGFSFVALAASSFPNIKDQELLTQELQDASFFDLFSFNSGRRKWACFACNHPEKVESVLSRAQDSPVLEGQLKEKKGRWKLFKRWRTRYFTLSGATLSYSASHFSEQQDDQAGIDLRQVRSVRSVSNRRSRRQIRKAFEIFTEDNCYVLKAKDRKNAEEWIQTLQIAVAQANKPDADSLSEQPQVLKL